MSTRSLTIVKDEDGRNLVTMYRHCDGYPEGHGQDLKDFMTGFRIVNGISSRDTGPKVANGMGCFAAQLIHHFKDGIGQIYLQPSPKEYEEYLYVISGQPEAPLKLQVYDTHQVRKRLLYAGTAEAMNPAELERQTQP